MKTAIDILQKKWGHTDFRPLQKEIIDAVLAKKNCIALLPTGGGKSLCYQIPALLQEGLVLGHLSSVGLDARSGGQFAQKEHQSNLVKQQLVGK